MKKYTLLQRKADYGYYEQLKDNGILPLLVVLTEKEREKLNGSFDFYTISELESDFDKQLYELDSFKLLNGIKESRINVEFFVSLEEITHRILEIKRNGYHLKNIGYRSIRDLGNEIIDKSKVKTIDI